jgi:hypothetical protein
VLGLLITPLVIPIPIAAFILWDSWGTLQTTELTLFEYYYFPLYFLRIYLLIAYAISITAILAVSLFAQHQWKKEI